MLDTTTAPNTLATAGALPADRRTRLRLRDLCDEVLASYRLASERDLFTPDDREAAKRLMRSVVTK